MHKLLAALTLAITPFIGSAQAQNATVVELYTSQGCSSCPPADAMLEDLAKRDNCDRLGAACGYWDYIGWVDDLADPAYTARQRAFARAKGSRTVYTPQMIFDGRDHIIGSRPMDVMDQIMAHAARPDDVNVTLTRDGKRAAYRSAKGRKFSWQCGCSDCAATRPKVMRDIHRGENAGRTIVYANVVTSWQNVGGWNTNQSLVMEAQLTGADPVAVIIQDGTDGPILGAAQLR